VFAIILNIVSSELICSLEEKPIYGFHSSNTKIRPFSDTKTWAKLLVPVLIILSGVFLVLAWNSAYFKIVQIGMK
jgi:hypothetical protein